MEISTHLPKCIKTAYPTPEPVVCDIVATDAPYLADASGEQDAAPALQRALCDLAARGGGTLFLPIGQYRLKTGLRVPPFCAIVGDFMAPDRGVGGTLILADVPSVDAPHPALFELSGSSGAVGLTVYYPNQSLREVKPYPFTFYASSFGGEEGGMLSSVQRCHVINGYRGLGACVSEQHAHEQFTLDGFSGTFLCTGAEVYNQSDVGTWKHVDLSPRFWANAPAWMKPPALADLRDYTRTKATGLLLGDLEWTEFADLRVDGYAVGMHIVKGRRIEFAGSVYASSIRDCGIGLRVDAIDERWGMVLAKSVIEGEQASIAHHAKGAVKMTDVTLLGSTCGDGELIFGEGRLSHAELREITPKAPPLNLITLPPMKGDCAEEMQRALDSLGEEGGILYLPAGAYHLDSPIIVPPGVQVRGSAIPTRDEGKNPRGTLILTDLRGGESDPALITLCPGASIFGVRVIWYQNGPHALHETPFAIRGSGEDVSCVNCAIVASSYGIDFRDCDRHLVKKLTSCCYRRTLVVGGKDGVIEGCLQNGTAIVRAHIEGSEGWVPEYRIFEELFPVTRMGLPPMKPGERHGPPPANGVPRREVPRDGGCIYLTVEGAQGECVYNTFAYGVASMTRVVDSKDILLVNLGSDNIAREQSLFENSEVLAVNLMRYNGTSFAARGGAVSMRNRLTILDKHEENF